MRSTTKMTTALFVLLQIFFLFTLEVTSNAEPFTHKEYEFRFDVPANFTVKENPAPNVGVLLTDKEQGYPTFNVVMVPGIYRAGLISEDKQTEQIISEYNGVGIKNIWKLARFKRKVANRNSFTQELRYKVKDLFLTSSVTKVSGSKHHYILTFIDRAERFDKSKLLRDRLLDSFRTWGDDQVEPPAPKHFPKLAWGLVVIGALGVIIALIKFKWHKPVQI